VVMMMMVVMAAMHGVVRVVMVMLVVMKAPLGAEGLRVGGAVGERRGAGRVEDERPAARVGPLGARGVGAAVAAGVAEVAAGALGQTWELERGGGEGR